MYELPEKLKSLSPYSPDMGEYPIRLDANESFIEPDAAMKAVIAEAVAAVPLNRYPDPEAKALRKAFADLYGLDKFNVAAGNGSDELISVIMNVFLCRGDTVVTAEPDFSMYRFYAHLCECPIISVDKGENLEIDAERLIKTVNQSGAKMLIFSNPCNPTSRGLDRETVRRIIRSVSALVVLDEAYMDFWDQSLIGEICEFDNCIMLRTCSKMLGMAALRLGFAMGSETLINAIMAAKSPYNINSVSQAIGCVVLGNRQYVNMCAGTIAKSTGLLYSKLKAFEKFGLTCYVTNTNFVIIKTEKAAGIFEYLKSKGILVRLLGGCLRITCGSETENTALISALEIFFEGNDD